MEPESVKSQLAKITRALDERKKELRCLHGIIRLVMTPGISVEELLEGVSGLVAAAMQFPERSAVRISYNNKTFVSGHFRDSGMVISSDIKKNNKSSGILEVCCSRIPENGSDCDFLAEEKDLINTVAGILERFLEFRSALEVLDNKEELLEEIGGIAKIGGWEYDPITGTKKWTDEVIKIHELKSDSEFEIDKGYNDYTPASRKLFEDRMRSSITTGRPFSIDCELITQNCQHKWVRVIGKPVESDGKDFKVRGTIQDITETKKAAQEVFESREYLRATLDSLGDSVIVTDIDGIITLINPAAESITGWKSEEAIGLPFEKVFRILRDKTGREINPVNTVLWRGNDSGIPDNLLLVTKKGNKIPVSVNATPIEDRNGKTTGIVLVFRDKSEEWLKEKIQDIRIRLFEYSVSHTLNELLVRIVDEVEELTGSKIGFYHFIPRDMGAVALQAWSTQTREKYCSLTADHLLYNLSEAGVWTDCIKSMEPVIHNDYASLEHKKGYPEGHAGVDSMLTVPVIRNNRVIAVIGVGNKSVGYTAHDAEILKYMADITWEVVEKMCLDEEVRKKESQLHLLNRSVEQGPVSIFITDTEGKIEYVNRTFLNSSGYSFDELKGKILRILKPGHTPENVHRNMWEKLRQGGDWHGEQQNRTKNGETYWEKVNLSAVKNLDGRIENFIALCEDITLQKKTESDLMAAKIKAEESDRLKSAFLANMSHEIRTPMNGILGFLQLLKNPEISDANREQYFSIVDESGKRLMNTINDIIEISQIEVGQLKIVFSEVDLKEVMDYLYRFFSPEAKSKGLELRCKNALSDDLGIIYSDKTKIVSVLTNLIKNALKFTSEGFVEFETGFSGRNLCICVKDSGIGIPADKLDNIFDRFVQADMNYSKGYEGSGLGLSIARSYAEALGGTISVKSEVGKGTSFCFALAFNPVNEEIIKDEETLWPDCQC